MTEQKFSLPEALVKTIDHFVPGFWKVLPLIDDARDPTRIVYPLPEEIFVGLLMFMLKTESRRGVHFKLNTPAFVANVQNVCRRYYPRLVVPDQLFHGDTLDYGLRGVDPRQMHELRLLIIRSLLRKRSLEDFRLQGLYYPVAIDGTGALVFGERRHCPHCLHRSHSGRTIYYHPVLEGKLALSNGMALSVGTEFIENEKVDVEKQDCELKAFYRMAKALKADLPQTRLCLLLDGLFACAPVVKLCEHNRWRYIITLQEGSLAAVFRDYEALLGLTPENARVVEKDGSRRTYRWINDVDFGDRTTNVFECVEDTVKGRTRFVWLTGFTVDAGNVVELAERGGRKRWTIENEGFNVQKNGGYGLEHAFSYSNRAQKNFYLLMQMGHIFNQLMEKGSLLRERIRTGMGSLKVFSQKMWAALTETVIDAGRLQEVLGTRIQIRLEAG